jgi:hypothetical protein
MVGTWAWYADMVNYHCLVHVAIEGIHRRSHP